MLSLHGRQRLQAYAAEGGGLVEARPAERSTAVTKLSTWLPIVALAVLVATAYAPYAGDYFVGGDTWAHIWTSRDIASVLTQPIMAGSGFPETVARFYRPVSSLSYTFQYALSGLNPVAFHLGDLLIHVAAMLSLAWLAIALGVRPWAATLGAAVVALHPAMASVVPAAPRRHDSLVTLGLCIGLSLVVWFVTSPVGAARSRHRTVALLVLSTVALAFAELAKEIGYVGLLLGLPTMLAACYGAGVSAWSRWRQIGSVLIAWGGVSIVLFAWHAHVVGGLGGYGPLSPFTDLDARVNELVQILLWPFRGYLQTYLKAWLIELGLVLLVVGLPILLIHRRAAATLAVGWVWLVLSGVFQLMSESTAPWQTYVTIAAFGLMIAAVLDGAANLWFGSITRVAGLAFIAKLPGGSPTVKTTGRAATRASVLGSGGAALPTCATVIGSSRALLAARTLVGAAVVGLAVFSLAVVRDSVLLTPYPEWHAAARVARDYLMAIRQCVDAAPRSEPVVLADWPLNVDDTTDQYRLTMAGVFAPYSVAPAVYLTMDRPGLSVLARKSEISVPPSNRGITATCGDAAGAWVVDAVYDPPLQQPPSLS